MSEPNDMHLEKINENAYSITVTTTKNNEVMVFEELQYNSTLPVSSVLRLNRIHAFCIPNYYSFGMKTTINTNFLINEMYNSKDKDISIRISSREDNTINDSTLKIMNMNLSISSIIYLGFIESYTNVLFLVTADAIRLFTIERPKIYFKAAPPGTLPELANAEVMNMTYCMQMGKIQGDGRIFLFKKNSTYIMSNPDANRQYYLKLYDRIFFYPLDNLFIGSDLHLTATPNEEYKGLILNMVPPLYLKYNFTDIYYDGFVEFASYTTNFETLRNHVIFIHEDEITVL